MTTVDAVLIYRLISFWLVLVIGWALWGSLALGVRRGRWSRDVLGSPAEAGPDVMEGQGRGRLTAQAQMAPSTTGVAL